MNSGPPRRSALDLTLGQLLVAGSAFAASVLSARALGLEARGQLALTLQVAYVLGPLLTFGMSISMLRGSSGGTTSFPVLVRIPVLLGLAAAAAMHLLGFSLFVVAGPLCGVAFSSTVLLRSSLIGRGRTREAAFCTGFISLGYLVGCLMLYAVGVQSAAGWLTPYLIAAVAFVGVSLVGLRADGSPSAELRLGAPQVPGALGQIVALRADRLMLAWFCGEAVLAVYVMAGVAIEASIWLLINHADASVRNRTMGFSPGLALRSVGRSVVPTLGLVAFGLAATQFLILPFIGPQYAGVTRLLLPLGLSTVALCVGTIASRWLVASPSAGRASIPSVVQAGVALPVYFVATRNWCDIGAAWGSVVVYSAGVVVALALLRSSRGVG